MSTVAQQPDTGNPDATEQLTLDRIPAAFAALYPPCARRRRWLAIYPCGHCGGHHQALSWTPLIAGLRRSGCGRRIWLVVARRYPGGAR